MLIEERIGARLRERRETLATAESCSGGLIAHRITNVPGASDYFLGGVVSYSNEVKAALLGVSEADLAAHGAVSAPVAAQMAQGARVRFRVDWAIGVTGVAGPGGGTKEKPVGLVYMAVAGPSGVDTARHMFSGTREAIKAATAEAAMHMLMERL